MGDVLKNIFFTLLIGAFLFICFNILVTLAKTDRAYIEGKVLSQQSHCSNDNSTEETCDYVIEMEIIKFEYTKDEGSVKSKMINAGSQYIITSNDKRAIAIEQNDIRGFNCQWDKAAEEWNYCKIKLD